MRDSCPCTHDKRILNRRISCWLGFFLALVCAGNVLADPPVITVDLPSSPMLVSSNTQVTLSISAVQSNVLATTALSFQWRRNGANIPGSLTNFVTSAITTTYKINNIKVTDGGAYSVAVFNTDGEVDSSIVNLIMTNPPIMQGADNFGSRTLLKGDLFGSTFSVRANNSSATSESGEPQHGNVPGGKSIWYAWVPNQQFSPGVWMVDTRGSDFDTTLSVYSDPGLSVTDVTALATSGLPTFESDDANYPNNYHNSSVTFNVVSGQTNAVAIDGFYGAKGDVILNFTWLGGVPPVATILSQPHSQTVASNSTVTLSFTVGKSGFNSYQWYRNGVILVTNFPVNGNNTNGSLTISNFSAADVGQYQAFVFAAAGNTNGIFTDPASVQINSQDGSFNPSAYALPKFLETSDTGFVPHIHPLSVAVSGFTGTHIWNTYGAAAEPGEPNHCGKVGGAPYWFSYLAPGSGALTVDANTTTYTNVLAVYTWPGGDFSTLVSVACASTNNGTGHEVSTFSAVNGTTYYLVVDGLNGATGNVTLAYSLVIPPVITLQPQSQTVAQGSNVTLTVSATGTPTPAYQWRTNTGTYLNKTNTSLAVTNFQATKEGAYDVVVTNTAGSVTSSIAMLYLNSPLRFTNPIAVTNGGFTATLLGIVNTNYIIQANTNLATTNWLNISTNNATNGILIITDTNYLNYSNRFFRALKK